MTGIDWELLTRYVAGTCTASEHQWVERVLTTEPEMADVVAAIRDAAVDADATVSAEYRATRLAAVKNAAPAVVEPDRSAPRFMLPARRRSLAAIAAGLLLVAGGSAAWLTLRRSDLSSAQPVRPAYSVVSTGLGQRVSLRLSDGSVVALAPGSTLRTSASYGERDRTIELDGEAVFTVVHDSTRPFAVRTRRVVATDLGTRFLVRAYADDPATDVVVAEGEVAVRQTRPAATLPADSVILGRAERVRVADDGHLDHARDVMIDDYFSWTEGRLVFRDLPLQDVARQLGRWYDIDVRLEPRAIGGRILRASVAHEAATDALEMIAASLDLRLSRAGRVFTLTASR